MAKIAYYFSGEWKDCQGNPSDYVEPVQQAVKDWQRYWENKEVFCYYEKGQGSSQFMITSRWLGI